MKKGFTVGSFDLLHMGHIMMLEDCKTVCDYLIVGVQSDPTIDRPDSKNKPVQSLDERVKQISALKVVDEVFVYHTEADLYDYCLKGEFDVRILGSDWEGKPFTGYDIPGLLEKCYFHKRNHSYSSSDLRRRVWEAEEAKRNKKS